jgi:hypothetical protein
MKEEPLLFCHKDLEEENLFFEIIAFKSTWTFLSWIFIHGVVLSRQS